MPTGNLNDKFKIDKADLDPLSASLAAEIKSAFASAESANQASAGIAAAVKKYVEAVVAVIETSISEEGFQKASIGGQSGAGNSGA